MRRQRRHEPRVESGGPAMRSPMSETIARHAHAFHCDDGGFSTVGMVLALLIALTLIFSSAQVYKIHSISADIQNVADVGALAAENQVAAYYTVAQACDAVALSMNMTACLTAGLGIVTACTPASASISAELMNASKRIVASRKRFVKEAEEGLNRYQRILPFIAAVGGASMTRANSSQTSRYAGTALLVPLKGDEVSFDESSDVDHAVDDAESESGTIAEHAKEAEESARRAKSSKHRAYMADCGNAPDYCMYERAKNVAGMPDALNRCAQNELDWTFSMALERSKVYYAWRLDNESPGGNGVDDVVDSEMRKRFYAYAVHEVDAGYVRENDYDESFEAHFPKLPRNTAEMRETKLYTDSVYPITERDGARVMHAWGGCPKAQSETVGMGSISDMESGEYAQCPACHFSAASLGKVASASTSIENGYEYSYRIVAEQAEEYEHAQRESRQAKGAVRSSAQNLFEKLKDAIVTSSEKRIRTYPPGRYGAVSVVANANSQDPNQLVPNGFVSTESTLSSRMALSASTLAPDSPDDANSSLTTLFDRVTEGGTLGSGVPRSFIEIWSWSLRSWNEGEQAIVDLISEISSSFPLEDVCGLGKWALHTFQDTIAALGLEPVELSTYKAVTVNSAHVLDPAQGEDVWAQRIYQVKYTYQTMGGSGVGNPIASAIDSIHGVADEKIDDMSKPFVVARIELFGGDGVEVPIEITLPAQVTEGAKGIIGQAFDAIQRASASLVEGRRWQ